MPSKSRDRQVDNAFAKIEKAMMEAKLQAINEVGRAMRDIVINRVAEKLNVDPEQLGPRTGERVSGKRGGRRKQMIRFSSAYGRYPKATITAVTKGVPLINFDGQWNRSDPGASYVDSDGRRVIIPGSFIARLKAGAPQSIYKRKYQKQPKDKPHGFPVRRLNTLGIYLIASQPEIREEIKSYFRNNFPPSLSKRVTLVIRKK